MIRQAYLKDIPQIMQILDSNLLSHIPKKEHKALEQSGFLIFAFNESELEQMILNTDEYIVLVAEKDNHVVGYAISHEVKDAAEKTLYHQHIAILPNQKGVAKFLLQAILKEARSRDYHSITCHISHSPIKNKASIRFHEKYGFKFVETKHEGDFEFGVYKIAIEK